MTEPEDEPKVEPKKKRATPKATATHNPFRKLTVSQRAEAAALWRTGTVTLEDLSKKFKKRPEAISRLLKAMGAIKGEGALEAAKKIAETIEARTLSDTEETMRRIASTREEHFKMAGGLAKLAWSELVRARQAGTDIANLKDLMTTLKLAGDVIGNARKELFAVLNVEKHELEEGFDHLPELTVRELTGVEISLLQAQPAEELTLESDVGGEMMPEEGL